MKIIIYLIFYNQFFNIFDLIWFNVSINDRLFFADG